MHNALAALASVDMNPPISKTWPTSSGHLYVSLGAISRVLTIKFALDEDPPAAGRLQENETLAALTLVTVNESMIVLHPSAVYCVNCEFSANLRGMMFFTDTLMVPHWFSWATVIVADGTAGQNAVAASAANDVAVESTAHISSK